MLNLFNTATKTRGKRNLWMTFQFMSDLRVQRDDKPHSLS